MKKIMPYGYDAVSLLIYSISFFYVDDFTKSFSMGLQGYIIFHYLVLFKRLKYNQLSLMFLFFSFTYVVYIQPYYLLDIPYHYLLETQSLVNTNTVLLLHIIFITTMFFGVREGFGDFRNMTARRSSPVFYMNISILIIMLPASIALNPPLFGEVYTGAVTSSVWIEYCIIFMIISHCYASTILKKRILLCVIVVYLLLPFMYDRRLQFLLYCLIIYALYFDGRFSNKTFFLSLTLSFILVRWYASIRMGTGLTIASSILSVDENGVMGNNQGGVILASTVYIQLIEDGIFDLCFGVKSAIGVLVSFVLPYKFNLPETYVNFSALNYRPLPGNGGFPGVYFYIWGGFLGCVMGGFLFRFLVFGKRSRLGLIFSLLMFVTYPKWHSYSLLITVKLGVWLMIFMALADFYYRTSIRRANYVR